MGRTSFEIDAAVEGHVTRGYQIDDSGKFDSSQPDREGKEGRGYKVPNGAMFTTVDDLARFLQFQLGAGSAEVLPPARLDSVYGGIVAATDDLEMGYGIGFVASRRGNLTWLGHDGAVAGYGASMLFDRKRGLGVIILRNALGGRVRADQLGPRILERMLQAQNSQ
jgi:CubicO group peptidase (beta-lactamase class C family)